MNDEPTMKLTDFDYLIGDHHLQMLKAALPYVNVPQQKFLSILVKCQELRHTMSLFRDEEAATLGICSLDESAPRSPLDMLTAIKPYGNTQEQDFIDMICNFLQGYRYGNQVQEVKSQIPAELDSSAPTPPHKPPFEQLKAFLSPEQQTRFDEIAMLVQAIQQFT